MAGSKVKFWWQAGTSLFRAELILIPDKLLYIYALAVITTPIFNSCPHGLFSPVGSVSSAQKTNKEGSNPSGPLVLFIDLSE